MGLERCVMALLVPVLLFAMVTLVAPSSGCNEAVCASLVSKCMLLKSCECNMMDKNNCTCCKTCHRCLNTLYTECCSCVGMCPDQTNADNMHGLSTVEELSDPIPGLFDVLTEEADPELRWTTHTYPAHLDLVYFRPNRNGQNLDLSGGSIGGTRVRHGNHHFLLDPTVEYHNCTVAYMSQCMSLNKCRTSCQSMGAAGYRWFHDYACCECIGSTCLDFGMGEAKCLKCPPPEEDEEYPNYDSEYQETGTTANINEKSHKEIETNRVFEMDEAFVKAAIEQDVTVP